MRRPDRVFLGDSITASGGAFGSFDTINLASNGLTTLHVASAMRRAQSLDPHTIFIMVGTNDGVEGNIDEARLRRLWRTMLADPRVTVTLSPHSRDPLLNRHIDAIDRIVLDEACRAGRRAIGLKALEDPDGLLRRDYTIDGVHFSPAAIAIWTRLLDGQQRIACPAARRRMG